MATISYTEETDNVISKITKDDKSNTDEMRLSVPESDTISIGDTVSYYDVDSNLLFKGVVQGIDTGNGLKIATVYDLGAELLQRNVNEIITSKSPEEIIEYIITNYTSLTYVSTITSGITIDIYPARQKRAWDIVTEMSELLLANFYVDTSGNFQLEAEGSTTSTKSISTNNSVLDGTWKEDKSLLVNSITVEGDRQILEKTESFAGPSTSVILSEIPESVYVTVGGTEKTGYVPGQSTGDYYVDKETKTINFDSSSSTIVVSYSYSIPISVRRRNALSISTYGQHDKVIRKTYVKTRDEARSLCEFMLNRFKNPLKSSTWIISNNTDKKAFNSYLPNQKISVTDSINGISGTYIIRNVVRESNGQLKVTVGDQEESILYWNKEVQDRIKQLEEKDNNSTLLNEDEATEENISLDITTTINRELYRALPTNYLYLGDANDSPVYANIGDGTARPLKDATGGVQPEFLITNKNNWGSPDYELNANGYYVSWIDAANITYDMLLESGDNILLESGDNLLIN